MLMQSDSGKADLASNLGYYSLGEYSAVEKIDAHVHVNTKDTRFVALSEEDNFRLLSINVDAPGFVPIQEQQVITVHQLNAFPSRFAYATSFKVASWEEEQWEQNTMAYLAESFAKGAVAVKVWKNIGMELKEKNGGFVMIDHPRFGPVMDFLKQHNVTLIGHLGEPKNCWLPVEEMTVSGDRNYFSSHPKYHMYLHPEYPSYESQIDARDRLLAKHPDLLFVGAHFGSLEWSVDELAARLDRFPNMAVDMAERISHLQHQAVTDWQKVREFFMKYQDQLIYGTDIIDDGTKEAAELKQEVQAIRMRHWKFFTSDEPIRVPKVEGEFKGLHLPRQVVDKIYRENAQKWYPKMQAYHSSPAAAAGPES
jgi:predicted TIM-barrel fold metal-dependent hydrolase